MPVSQLCSLWSGGQGSLSREHSQLRKGLKTHPLEETGEAMGARSEESSADWYNPGRFQGKGDTWAKPFRG